MKELSLEEIDNMEPLEYVAYLADMNVEMDYELAVEENAAKAEKTRLRKRSENWLRKSHRKTV